jgi:hypothetical protein
MLIPYEHDKENLNRQKGDTRGQLAQSLMDDISRCTSILGELKILNSSSRRDKGELTINQGKCLTTTQYDELSENLSSNEADEDRSFNYSSAVS